MTEPNPAPSTRRRRRRAGAADLQATAARTDASTPETESLAATTLAPVEVRQGAIGRADGTTIDVHQGAVGAARADAVSVDQGALGAALAGEARVSQGVVGTVVARTVAVEQSFVRTLVAGEVRVERATGVGFLLARRVVGDVRVLFDWRGALAFGAAAGFVAGLVRRGAGRRAKDASSERDSKRSRRPG